MWELCSQVPAPYEAVGHSMFLLVAIQTYSLLAPDRSMGSACVDTTQQETIVRNVHLYTTTSLGSQEMEKQERQMNAEVSGREFTDPGFQDGNSLCPHAKLPGKDSCHLH